MCVLFDDNVLVSTRGTQENGWHDVMRNATQSSNNISHDPIATAIENNNYDLQKYYEINLDLKWLNFCISCLVF